MSSHSDSSVACAQRWVMAVPWHVVLRWGAPWDRFGLMPRPERSGDAVVALERHWNIATPQDVERSLASLGASANARDAAWHLSNIIVVAQLAFAAFLIDEARAWQAAVDAARALQRHHRGWFSMAEGYLRGLAVNRPESPDPDAREFLIGLHAQPDSPWNTLAWTTELPERLPPPQARDVVVDVDHQDALEAALVEHPRARIRLAPGTYFGPLSVDGQVLERSEHAPLGTVIIEADGTCLSTRGACLRGLIIRGGDAPAVVAEGGFLRIEECHFEGGTVGLAAKTATIVQLDGVVFEGLSDTAVVLADGLCRARNVTISEVGAGFTLEGARLSLEDALVESADRAGIIAHGGMLHLRKVRVHDAERWGIALAAGVHAELDDVEVMRSLVGLRAAEGATIQAERSRFADCATANIELLDIGGARFSDCHITGGDWTGVWLHPGHGATFRGGQVGGSRQACVMIEGGREVGLHGVGIGPSHEGGGLFIAAGAYVKAEQVFVSGLAMAGVELRASTLMASDLRVRGSLEGILVRDGARFEGHRIDLAELRGSGFWLVAGTAVIAGLGLRKATFGVVVGSDACLLVQNFVCAHTPVAAQVEGGRLAMAGRITLGNSEALRGVESPRVHIRVKAGQLAARGLEGALVVATDAELYLEGATFLTPGSLEVQGRSRVFLTKCAFGDEALHTSAEAEVVRDPALPPITAMSPMSVGLVLERFTLWGVTADPGLLLRVIAMLVLRLGVDDKIVLREIAHGVRLDGPFAAIAHVAPHLSQLYAEPGALGVILAEVVTQPVPRDPPKGLA